MKRSKQNVFDNSKEQQSSGNPHPALADYANHIFKGSVFFNKVLSIFLATLNFSLLTC